MPYLIAEIKKSFHQFPDNIAVEEGTKKLSYMELQKKSEECSAMVENIEEHFVGVWATKTINTYCAILGSLFSQKGFVPLGPSFPAERLAHISRMTNLRHLFYPGKSSHEDDLFRKYLEVTTNMTIFYSERNESLERDFKQHSFKLINGTPQKEISYEEEKEAYILFTSGSTGLPKGVPISLMNLDRYINRINNYFNFNSRDRFSHTFELTFDLSIHDIFISWSNGGTLVIPTTENMYLPHTYIEDRNLSVWFSVPSLAMNMGKMGLLNNKLKSLRYSLFCGEALPASIVKLWSLCMTNSSSYNLYGPTEATIAFSIYPCGEKSENGLLSIGRAMPGLEMKISNEGELLLSGDQLSAGYWRDKSKNEITFINIDGKRWYKTGDRAQVDKDGDYFFLSRLDHQVKLNGYRIEISEIELFLRKVVSHEVAFCIPFPVVEGKIESLYAVVKNLDISEAEIKAKLALYLPEYMIPLKVVNIDSIPLNSSGKTDRKKIFEYLGTI